VHTVALRAALEVIASAAAEIGMETGAARRRMEEPPDDAELEEDTDLVLRATYETDPGQPVLTWLVREPEGINTGSTDRWRPAIHWSLTIERPAGYLIPAAEQELVAALLRHGFELSVLEEPRRLRVGRYPVGAFASRADTVVEADTVKADTVEADTVEADTVVDAAVRADGRVTWQEEEVPAGTFYVDLGQPASLLVAAILEPWSQDSWYSDDAERAETEATWHLVTRVESPIETGTRAVPTALSDGILGGP
jgi:hypothetical protein